MAMEMKITKIVTMTKKMILTIKSTTIKIIKFKIKQKTLLTFIMIQSIGFPG